MEVIDDWRRVSGAARAGPAALTATAARGPAGKAVGRAAAAPVGAGDAATAPRTAVPTVQALAAQLADFDPTVLTLHGYDDLGLRWIALTFDAEVIAPEVALRAGARLAPALAPALLLFSSLRPRGVVFLLDAPAGESADPEAPGVDQLPPSRYGVPLAAVQRAWTGAAAARRR